MQKLIFGIVLVSVISITTAFVQEVMYQNRQCEGEATGVRFYSENMCMFDKLATNGTYIYWACEQGQAVKYNCNSDDNLCSGNCKPMKPSSCELQDTVKGFVFVERRCVDNLPQPDSDGLRCCSSLIFAGYAQAVFADSMCDQKSLMYQDYFKAGCVWDKNSDQSSSSGCDSGIFYIQARCHGQECLQCDESYPMIGCNSGSLFICNGEEINK